MTLLSSVNYVVPYRYLAVGLYVLINAEMRAVCWVHLAACDKRVPITADVRLVTEQRKGLHIPGCPRNGFTPPPNPTPSLPPPSQVPRGRARRTTDMPSPR